MKIAPLAAALMLVSAGACSQEGPSATTSEALGSASAATVNGRPVPESVLRIYSLATERRNLEDLSAEDRQRILEDVIGLQLLAEQAEQSGLLNSRTLAAQLELQRLQIVARAMAQDYMERNPPTEADIQAIYDENLPRLTGAQYKARHILVTTKEEADDVLSQLRQGADFVELAEQRADGPTGPNGGALDWFTLDSMPPTFAEAVRNLAVGAYSAEPVQTEYGFHVILLEDSRQQEPPALADIRAELQDAAERKRLDDYVRMLRESAVVSTE